MSRDSAAAAKSRAAWVSIGVNSALIAFKLAVGVISGSISIISEAVHSSTDLAAAVIALVSVRKASQPADLHHRYGHDKVENFSGFIEAAIVFARTQGGHGSESRTGEIMKEIVAYGSAARGALPALRELIVDLNTQCQRGEFPAGELNNRRIRAVKAAITAIEAATTHPELRSISPAPPGVEKN